MALDEKSKKTSAYMRRLIQKIEKDNKGTLSYAEKQGLGMFADLHIGQIYPQWQEWDENKKAETLKALSVQDLNEVLGMLDENNVPVLFSMSNNVRFELLEKMAKADIIFKILELMQKRNKYGESILEQTSYDDVYGPKIGQLFGELKQKADRFKTVNKVQSKRKTEKQKTNILIKKAEKDQKSY